MSNRLHETPAWLWGCHQVGRLRCRAARPAGCQRAEGEPRLEDNPGDGPGRGCSARQLSMSVQGPGGTAIHRTSCPGDPGGGSPRKVRAAARTSITGYKMRQPVIHGFTPTDPEKLTIL
jgi:hypothetical protein